MRSRAIVLLSGGIDSTVCASIATNEHGNDNVFGLTISYGQRHTKELLHASRIAKELQLGRHDFIKLDDAFSFSGTGCALVDNGVEVPEESYETLQQVNGPSPMYVPFRNGILLGYAAAYALQTKARFIYYGAHAEDARNFAYPDTTPEFNGAMMNAIYIGSGREVKLLTPLQWMTKPEIIELGLKIKAPLSYTYSCYSGRELHCGKCATCVSRIRAFKLNETVDPAEYEIHVDWGSLPGRMNLID